MSSEKRVKINEKENSCSSESYDGCVIVGGGWLVRLIREHGKTFIEIEWIMPLHSFEIMFISLSSKQ